MRDLHSFPTRRSSDLQGDGWKRADVVPPLVPSGVPLTKCGQRFRKGGTGPYYPTRGEEARCMDGLVQSPRSEDHTSELQSLRHLVCRLLLEKKKELQQNNVQLTQQAQQLAEQNAEVERKNQEIEQARRQLEATAEELALTSKYKSAYLDNMT